MGKNYTVIASVVHAILAMGEDFWKEVRTWNESVVTTANAVNVRPLDLCWQRLCAIKTRDRPDNVRQIPADEELPEFDTLFGIMCRHSATLPGMFQQNYSGFENYIFQTTR